MAEAGRWVVVNPETETIVGGPYLWDGEAEWAAPEITGSPDAGYQLVLEADALERGYGYPPHPAPPIEPWVLVDYQAMTVVAGPFDWDGQSDPPPALPTGDTQSYLRGADAQARDYIYP